MTYGPSQGMNLGGKPGAYADSFITLDLMRGQGDWEYWNGVTGVILPRDELAFDDRGWLTGLPVVNGVEQPLFLNVFYGSIAPPQDYIMEWTGEGEISVNADYEVIGDNRILVRFRPDYVDEDGNPRRDGLAIELNSTDPNRTGNHIRDIRIYRVEDADLVAAGERFNPVWFDRVDDFRVLRTHDWQSTNFPTQVDWTRNSYSADQADWGLEGRGMPYELLVQMANQTRSDLWINIPHTASDQFMREAAAYVRANLDPDLRVLVEFSNEYWTSIFDQYQYFIDGGSAAFGDADFAAGQFYGTRATHMAEIFAAGFGEGSARLRPVLTVDDRMFLSGEAEAMLTAPDHVAQGGQAPVSAGFRVLATDGYLGWYGPDPDTAAMILGWMAEPDGGFGAARDFLLDQLEAELLPNWQAGRALADRYGLEFMVYEGGTLLLNGPFGDPAADPRITDFNIRFTQSQELRAVYEAVMAAWQEVGTGPFAWYSDVGAPGPWGDYGHWTGIDFAPDPRTGVITDANRDLPPWWDSDDTRPDSTFDNGRYAAGSMTGDRMTGTALHDRLYGLSGDDRLTGFRGADRLWGGAGDDQLAGGRGADDLNGGEGRDWADYATSASGVTVHLGAGQGSAGDAAGDRLAGVENLRGSAGDDRLIGDAGANVLAGGTGRDTLRGGDGDDFLRGGAGVDALLGGAGDDAFVFRGSSEAGDRIADFNAAGDDIILLWGASFGGRAPGILTASEFQSGPGHAATNASVRFLFDTQTSSLWYDPDGKGGASAVLLLRLQPGTVLDHGDVRFF